MTTAARTVTKNDLQILSNLVFESYLTQEMEFQGLHIVFRTLTTQEREDITRRYKYVSSKHNIFLVLEILSKSIMFVEGDEFKRDEHTYLLNRLSSRVVLTLYKFYQEIDDKITQASSFIDYYLESRDSRNSWSIFKTCSRITDPFSLKKLNQYQYYWLVMNCYKDSLEEEKKSWAKVEYMTNSICAFINPKGYKSSKNHLGIVEQLEQNEDKSKKFVVDQLENGESSQVPTNDVFSSLERLSNESEEEHEIRVNILMEKTLKGELIDEHDRLVREDELKQFKAYLMRKRKEIIVQRELYKRRGIQFDSTEILQNEKVIKQVEEDKKKGFYHDDYSYLEIVRMKDFCAISKDEKLKAFEEAIAQPIDLEKEVESYLKSLSSSNDSKVDELSKTQPEPVTIVDEQSQSTMTQTDSSNIIKTAAQRAANMNVNIKEIDLLQQRQDKLKKVDDVLDNRRQALDSDGLDVMKFN